MKYKITIFILLLFFKFSSVFANDSLYINDIYFQKLLKTNSSVPIFYNDQVKQQIGVYLKNYMGKTTQLIGKTQYYYQLYSHEFEKAGVPIQLFLTMAATSESNLLFADQDGATGLWPLSYISAKKYQLITNSYVDERKNPVKSAQVAAKYFSDLNVIYMDWLKSLAAFRAGPINMNMAIHKSGNSMDYSKIHNQLSSDYQKTVVNYMAFWYVWNFYNEHRLVPIKFKLPDADSVHVQREISISAIAYQLNLSEELLNQMNSELRLAIVPTFYNQTGFKLPKDKVAEYKEKQILLFPPIIMSDSTLKDTLILDDDPSHINYAKKKIPNDEVQIGDESDEDETPKAKSNKNEKVSLVYKVKKGDGLLLIADLFDCKVSDIRKWNGMKKDIIFAGQKLKIMVPKSKLAQYKKINSMTAAQKKKLAKKS